MEQRVANEVASCLYQAKEVVAQFHQLLLGFRGCSGWRGVILPTIKVMVIRRTQRPHGVSDKLRVNVVLVQPAEGVNIEDTAATKKLLCCVPQNIKVNSHSQYFSNAAATTREV